MQAIAFPASIARDRRLDHVASFFMHDKQKHEVRTTLQKSKRSFSTGLQVRTEKQRNAISIAGHDDNEGTVNTPDPCCRLRRNVLDQRRRSNGAVDGLRSSRADFLGPAIPTRKDVGQSMLLQTTN